MTCSKCGHELTRGDEIQNGSICIGCPCPLDHRLREHWPASVPEWLSRGCCEQRAHFETPFALEHHGRWACVTNGRCMIAVRCDDSELRAAPSQITDESGQTVTKALFAERGSPVEYASLAAWALNGAEADSVKVCTECDGTKVAKCDECRGRGRRHCVCSECGDEHDGSCEY